MQIQLCSCTLENLQNKVHFPITFLLKNYQTLENHLYEVFKRILAKSEIIFCHVFQK